jgi:hypothetical protein
MLPVVIPRGDRRAGISEPVRPRTVARIDPDRMGEKIPARG